MLGVVVCVIMSVSFAQGLDDMQHTCMTPDLLSVVWLYSLWVFVLHEF